MNTMGEHAFERFDYSERLALMNHFYDLERKGLFCDGFWTRLATNINNDPDMGQVSHMTPMEIKRAVDFFLTRSDLTNDDERYYESHGEWYEDYCIPTFEEDEELVEDEEDDDEESLYN